MATFTQGRPKCSFSPNCLYDGGTETLLLEFTAFRKALAPPPLDGRPYVYIYTSVPVAVGNNLSANDFDGTIYNNTIRGLYPFSRVS